MRALPRRPGVVVVADEEPPAPVWAAAVELGAERVAVLPADEGWLVSRVASALRRPVDRGRLVVVGGSCGGASVAKFVGWRCCDTDVERPRRPAANCFSR